jgi:galactokinase
MTRIFSPYRLCPIGAHIDHQGGAVLGRTLALGTILEYEPLDSNEIVISSDQFGESKFTIGELNASHWTRYAQAAVRVLQPQRGLKAHVNGSLIGAGLSSSASVALAYLQALADVNDITLTPAQLIQKEFELEHDVLGLQIGLLDPLTIVHGRRDSLLLMDTVAASVAPIVDPPSGDFAWIVAYSGVSRELTKSGFNVRVAECHEAAALLQPGAWKLSDVPRELFEEKKMSLPEHLRKRAEHFFTEVERVQAGAEAWCNGDLFTFGQLMNQSCQSSIYNYESGSYILIELQELVSVVPGVYGSRFSGGGYGGCVVALVKRDKAERARTEIAKKFSMLHPELPSRVFIAEMGDGIFPSAA